MAQLNSLIVTGDSRFLNTINGDITGDAGTVGGHATPASGDASTTQIVLGNDSRLSNSRTPTSHTHGNIQNGGTLQTTDVAIASGDKLVVTDSSDSNKVARTSLSFDGSTTTKCLTQKGTFESFTNNAGTITSVKTTAGAHTAINVTSGAANFNVPTKTSHLTNDSGFITTYTNNRRAFFGTCPTAAATAKKVVTLSNSNGWELVAGTIIGVKFSITNTASSVTLNVNNTGDKSIYYNNAVYTGNSNGICGYANRTTFYMYDGTYWVFLSQAVVDSNSDTYDRNRYTGTIKCNATTAIVAGNIIVGKDGVFHHLKDGTAFDINYPILYANGALAVNATGNNNYNMIAFTITTTQSISMTAYKPVYIKGILDGSIFKPISTTPLTQTVPTTADGYYYMLLGVAYSATNLYLNEDHRIFVYRNYQFLEVVNNMDSIAPGVWTSTVTCSAGDTSVIIQDLNITPNSTLTPYCENSSGTPVGITSVEAINGSAVIKFPALEEATTFKLLIDSVSLSTETPINAQGVFIDTNNIIKSETTFSLMGASYTAIEDCVVDYMLYGDTDSAAYVAIDDILIREFHLPTRDEIFVKKGQTVRLKTATQEGSYIVYGIQQGSHANVLIDYSTEEVYTGQHWIDGKGIYTKYIDFGTHKMNQNTGSNAWIGEQYLNKGYVIPIPSGTILQYLDCYVNVENGFMYPVICGPSSHSNLVFMHFRDNSNPVFTGLWIKYVKQ